MEKEEKTFELAQDTYRSGPPPRQVIRIQPDGKFRVVEDITEEEVKKVFMDLVKFAAEQYAKAQACEKSHKA